MTEKTKAPLNWPAIIVLVGIPIISLIIIPLYSVQHDFSAAAWWMLLALFVWGGMSITTGYHRLWSHSTFKAALPVRLFLMLGGTLALQNSILYWSANHRTHHRYIDDHDKDPYCAKKGFWFSHMGWMIKDFQTSNPNFNNVPDLLKDKLVMFQHKYYLPLAILMNVPFVLLLGYLVNDVWGVAILAGLVRIMLTHHTTFFINSLAHMFGSQPYTDENTARDNFFLAFFTFGEGYHNYHHIFQNDYRNGVKWWQFDPTKWTIVLLSKLGLAYQLKAVPEFTIRKAEADMAYKNAQKRLEKGLTTQNVSLLAEVQALKEKLLQEYEAASQTMLEWTQLQERKFEMKKEALAQKWSDIDAKLKAEYQAKELRMKQHCQAMKDMLSSAQKLSKVTA